MVSRRQVLLGGAAAGGLVLLGGAGLAACGDGGEPAADPPDDTTGQEVPAASPLDLPDAEGLAAIGVVYLAAVPEEASVPALSAALELPPDTSTSPAALLQERTQVVHDEFASGDVVDVDGWVLARTEARIAALAAFESAAPAD